MAGSKRKQDLIPDEFGTIEHAADFWDSHSLADYPDLLEQVSFDVDLQRRRLFVGLDPTLAEQLAAEAQRRGVSTETLVNLWLSDKLHESVA